MLYKGRYLTLYSIIPFVRMFHSVLVYLLLTCKSILKTCRWCTSIRYFSIDSCLLAKYAIYSSENLGVLLLLRTVDTFAITYSTCT